MFEAQRYGEAGDVARRALQDFPKQEAFKGLVAEAEEKIKEQKDRERIQREVQQRIQEIRSKIKRQELTDAIDLAKQTLATLGPHTDVTQLLHAAEVESDERTKKREEAHRQLQAARALVEGEDFAGARQLLDRAIANRILPAADMQARMLLSQITEKEEMLRKDERKRTPNDKGGPKGGQIPSTPHLPSAKAPPRVEPTLAESATSIAGSVPRQKPSVPVLTPLPAIPPQAPAIQAKIRTDERVPETPAKLAAGGPSRKLIGVAVFAVMLAGGIYAGVRFIRKAPEKPSAEDVALEAEARQLWNDHKMDESLADWKMLGSHSGLLQDEAVQQASDIEQKHIAVEQLYAQGMKLLYEEKKYPDAAQKFNDVLQMNLWKMDEARREYDIASKGPDLAVSATPAANPVKSPGQDLFDKGQKAFNKKDYDTALQYVQQASGAEGVSKEINDKAQRLLLVIRNREEQKKSFAQASGLEQSGQKQQAKEMFERVVASPNGDSALVASAKTHINQIAAISQPSTSSNTNPSPTKNPPDFGPVIGEVRGLISQGRWDDADARLKGMPSTLDSYNDLKQQIASGRREDQQFAQAKALFQQAKANKNSNVLRNLRPFFLAEANKAGTHGGDARNIVSQIDAALNATDSARSNGGVGGGDAPHLRDVGGIKAALDNYARAVDNGDMYAFKAVVQLNAKDAQKLSELLNSFRGTGYALQNCSNPDISGGAAKVSCDAVTTKIPNSKRQRTKFQLALVSGRWMIVSTH